MAIYKKTQAGDKTIYTDTTNNKQVPADQLDPALKEELDLADFGAEIDDETVTRGEGDGVVDANGNPVKKDETEDEADKQDEAAAAREQRVNPYGKPVPQSEKGFGFPRKNGKTVDIFDGKTPHTHVRSIGALMVPLSAENYSTKTDAEIYDRLIELELV